MSDNKPVADVTAILGDGDASRFVQIGAVFVTKKGNLSFTLDAEPTEWRGTAPRRCVITARKGWNIEVMKCQT